MLRYGQKSVQSGVSAAAGRLVIAAGLAVVSAAANVAFVGRQAAGRDASFSSLVITFRKTNAGLEPKSDAEGRLPTPPAVKVRTGIQDE